MQKNTQIKILEKIQELVPQAPDDWAVRISEIMGKSRESIYAYARGDKGVRKGYPREVLRHLIDIIDEETRKTEKLLK